ncbi:DUF5994 family protein [Streptomyces sp. NPDC001795]|uniref:DUF5994 family protein n=1 Tax=Streptomyces sp. NPDC001795 TaxID=3154525 RepID=UPI00332FA3C9
MNAVPTPPTARLRLAARSPHGRQPRRIDGAWWRRSYDLTAELPALLDQLPRAWVGSPRDRERCHVVRVPWPDADRRPDRTSVQD